MIIRDLFSKDINRSINGVVKVEQDDQSEIAQELEEYVVTRELGNHFARFFEAYDRAIDVPTDKMGVWISGFFGSGKSHFLKMLSYLLANPEVRGKRAIDYFDGKVSDPMVESRMRRAASIPTEAILFNIDSKGGQWKSGDTTQTALLRAFERVFFEHLGFYGADLKLARLEQFIDAQGKTDEFRAAFERLNGDAWVDAREAWAYWEDDIVAALQQTLGMSEAAAQHWFDGTEDDAIAPDVFSQMVADYADRRAKESGGNFRLLFMVDEVGQFIGRDGSLMLSLQTLVENLGARCRGRVWVMVTSQEAIDELDIPVGDDFSKIQGRFDTRLSLSSSSVDEVIQRRVLEKTHAAAAQLHDVYEGQAAVLRNLFTFDESRGDLGGYASQTDFVNCYPFVGYQFKLLPDVMEEVRKHGVKAKHISTGERSMLSAFQESVQVVQDAPLGTLVPFWRFFDTISKDLEHGIVTMVDRANRAAIAGEGLEPQDILVLKLLYLIRYLTQIKATIGNIVILMVESIDADKVALREGVTESLNRLVRENYVARQGDTYNFLTDEEQEISRRVRETDVEPAQVVEQVKKVLFGDLYTKQKLSYGANDFPVDRYVDDSLFGVTQNGMGLKVVTFANDLSRASDEELMQRSMGGDAYVVLSSDTNYWDLVEESAKIRKYVKTINASAMPPSTQKIIDDKNKVAAFNDKQAKTLLGEAVVGARCAVNGHMVDLRATSAAQVFDRVLQDLAEATFTKAKCITAPVGDDNDVRRILTSPQQGTLDGSSTVNPQAAKEIETYLEVNETMHQQITMAVLQDKFQGRPFGWRAVDVAATVAGLIVGQRVQVSYAGQVVPASDAHLVDLLRKQAAKAQVSLRRKLDEALVARTKKLLKDLRVPASQIADDEDALVAAVAGELESRLEAWKKLYADNYRSSGYGRVYTYPGAKTVEDAIHTVSELLEHRADNVAFLTAFTKAGDKLLDTVEDMEPVEEFCSGAQKNIFDDAARFANLMKTEGVYLDSEPEAKAAIGRIEQILKAEGDSAWRGIKELHGLMTPAREAHDRVVRAKRDEQLEHLEAACNNVRAYVAEKDEFQSEAQRVISGLNAYRETTKSNIHGAKTAAALDAIKSQIEERATSLCGKVDDAIDAARAKAAAEVKVPAATPAGENAVSHVYERPQKATPAPVPVPKVKKLQRTSVFKYASFKSEEDIDNYLADVREQLVAALADNDSVRLS